MQSLIARRGHDLLLRVFAACVKKRANLWKVVCSATLPRAHTEKPELIEIVIGHLSRSAMRVLLLAAHCALLSAWAAPSAIGGAHVPASLSTQRVASGAIRCDAVAPPADQKKRRKQQQQSAVTGLTPVKLSPWVALRGAIQSKSFGDFMKFVRREQGDSILLDLRPVLPRTYVLMGKEANRGVLSELDPSLDQILQELINLLPVSARIPSEVDVELQKDVARLFQNTAVVNERLPSFTSIAQGMRERWVSDAQQQQQQQQTVPGVPSPADGLLDGSSTAFDADGGLDVFLELSKYVLKADLEVLYGTSFTEKHAPRLISRFGEWVSNIANGQLVGFFDELGEVLREVIAERRANPAATSDERCVLQVYLESGALERHDDDAVIGLLSMTLMAAVFNTQASHPKRTSLRNPPWMDLPLASLKRPPCSSP